MRTAAKALLAAGMGMHISLLAALLADAGSAADLVRVGEAPVASGGAFSIARAKGYFEKLGLRLEERRFEDSSSAISAMTTGEIDLALLPVEAGLFNAIGKGAPLLILLDAGHNRRGFGATGINVATALYDEGVSSVREFVELKGKRFGVAALGDVHQYNAALSLIKARLDPARDVEWIAKPQRELIHMLERNEVDAINVDFQFGYLAQTSKWGPIIISDDQIAPDAEISVFAVRKEFLAKSRDPAVRFAMAYLRAIREFNAAARDPAAHSDIVDILAQNTTANDPDLMRAIAPNWSYIADDGAPLVNSLLAMQEFWSGRHFSLVEKKASRQQLSDLSLAKEAGTRLQKQKPFGT
jgi:NitT/TauT family transport system substrate-binding protein